MKEIKFRIFDKEKSKIRFDFIIETKSYEKDFKKCIKDYDGNILKDIEIMQYTGLKDKNGKEIYEGDIVHYLDACNFCLEDVSINTGVVNFDLIDGIVFSNRDSVEMEDIDFDNDVAVIGNIYENPELNPY
ncbi:hypothetical protein BKN14_00320 [Candidatus Gracilibacteria bacterium HOT-871]|nr:hypothetical protein BKN14_00320 [Candidatus Gracilibacteria bacterium HOT-871]